MVISGRCSSPRPLSAHGSAAALCHRSRASLLPTLLGGIYGSQAVYVLLPLGLSAACLIAASQRYVVDFLAPELVLRVCALGDAGEALLNPDRIVGVVGLAIAMLGASMQNYAMPLAWQHQFLHVSLLHPNQPPLCR